MGQCAPGDEHKGDPHGQKGDRIWLESGGALVGDIRAQWDGHAATASTGAGTLLVAVGSITLTAAEAITCERHRHNRGAIDLDGCSIGGFDAKVLENIGQFKSKICHSSTLCAGCVRYYPGASKPAVNARADAD